MLAILGGPTATAACGADGGGFGFAIQPANGPADDVAAGGNGC